MSTIRQVPERIAYLILMYMHGLLTKKEREELDVWLQKDEQHKETLDNAMNI